MVLIKAFLFFCCASVAFGRLSSDDFESVLIGPEYCGKGQGAWCQNFSTAVGCNAVKHCFQSVWLTSELPSHLQSCGNCETAIQNFRQGIGSNTTKEVLKEFLENVCSLTFITELFHKRCEMYVDQYVDTYFNDLLEMLKSDISPGAICHILGFCVKETSLITIDTDDVVVRFNNIVLHLPANVINLWEPKKLLGSARCTWGPSYWCNNITSAKECKSISHCTRNVWPKQKFEEDNDSVCQVCKDMVKQARDQLQSNETQAELRAVFEGSCKLIPIKDVREECIKLADEFVPELTEMLVSEMNPTAICTVAGLCNSARIDQLLSLSKNTIEIADSCTNCTAALLTVERYLQRTSQNQLLDLLQRLCFQLSSYSEICSNLLISNIGDVHNFLLREMHPFPVCHLSGMCAHQYHLHPTSSDVSLETKAITMLANANDDLPCDLCKQLVTHFKEILTSNTTEDEFLEILQGICRQTGKFAKTCSEIVDDDFQKFYQFLTQELDASEVCRDVNLCPRGNMVTDENLNLIFSRISSNNDDTRIEVSPPAVKRTSDAECRFCRVIIQVVQKEIDKPEYEHNIEKLLEKICTLVPSSDRAKCDKFIHDYADTLVKILTDQTDPKVVCAMLDLCPRTRPIRNQLCPLCQEVMHYVQQQLQNPEEEEKIEDIVKRVCRFVPKAEKDECNNFITDYIGLIISVLGEETDPALVCPVLKLCPSNVSALESCTQCQRLFVNLIDALENNRSESDVVDKMRTLQSSASSAMTVTALQLRFTHRDDVVDMMAAEFDAPESCAFLRYCDDSLLEMSNAIASQSTNVISDGDEAKPSCPLCKLMVHIIEEKLTSNASEAEIEDTLRKFCQKSRKPIFRAECTHFVDKHMAEMLNLLKQHVKPKDLCDAVKLCSYDGHDGIADSGRCELCEAVVGSMESIAGDPIKVRRSMARLMELCRVFGEKDESTCMKIVSYVGPQLEEIALGIPSWYYCSKIRMCPYDAHLTYKRGCVADNDEWCLNTERAVLCDKLEHCRRNVWKSVGPSL